MYIAHLCTIPSRSQYSVQHSKSRFWPPNALVAPLLGEQSQSNESPVMVFLSKPMAILTMSYSGYGFIFAGRPKHKTRKEWIEVCTISS